MKRREEKMWFHILINVAMFQKFNVLKFRKNYAEIREKHLFLYIHNYKLADNYLQ